MKMPSRPWFPPLKTQQDIFGLHYVPLLGAAYESDAERARRFAKVEAGVTAVFKAAVHHVGEDRARQLFRKALRRPHMLIRLVHYGQEFYFATKS